jgi:hypothetical protein
VITQIKASDGYTETGLAWTWNVHLMGENGMIVPIGSVSSLVGEIPRESIMVGTIVEIRFQQLFRKLFCAKCEEEFDNPELAAHHKHGKPFIETRYRLRHPTIVKVRDSDKGPEDCGVEQLEALATDKGLTRPRG